MVPQLIIFTNMKVACILDSKELKNIHVDAQIYKSEMEGGSHFFRKNTII